jgi:8-oxo-dGTP pyrophosphatase MutT (NUDIX family)
MNKVENLPENHKVLFQTEAKNALGVPFITVKQNDYYTYAERAGVDSVAFVLYDKNNGMYGLINEYKPPVNEFLTTAFGGSIDKELNPFSDVLMRLKEIVKEETQEEAGYTVDRDQIVWVGSYFCSTQMNQYVHLFVVELNKEQFTGRKPENEMEEVASVIWFTYDEVLDLPLRDWKSFVAVSKHRRNEL